jgi:hypothetical protein
MGTHLYEHRVEFPKTRAAWLASILVHASLLAGMAWLSWAMLGRGARLGGEVGAESGVVLGLAVGDAAEPLVEDATGETGDARGGEPVLDAIPTTLADSVTVEGVAGGALAAPDGSIAPLAPTPTLSRLTLDGGRGRSRSTEGSANGSTIVEGAAGAGDRPPRVRLGHLMERATVTVFGAVGEGSRFIYLFDRSTSMTGAPLAAAKQQLTASLDALTSVHQFQVIFFNHEIQAWDMTGGQGRIPYATDANKRLAAQFLRTIGADGATERLAPLRRALDMNADVVFFLTDADDAMPDYDVAEVLDRAQGRGTAIACIEFGEGPQPEGENFLHRIAAGTGGDYVYVDVTTLGAAAR